MAGSQRTFGLARLNRRVVVCRKCPRLIAHCRTVARTRSSRFREAEYWGRPVPSFGDPQGRIAIIGLAPGAHGSNRTGRMFTGDASGDFLFAALHRAGLASRPDASNRDDGMVLRDCYITAAVRCCPPGNRPTAEERRNCRGYLVAELELLEPAAVLLCLGQIAFEETIRALGRPRQPFKHGVCYDGGPRPILCSYHVSRQNTQTGRLTTTMFDEVLIAAKRLAGL